MNWKNMMKGCFGDKDKIFGEHPADEQRARDMLKKAIDANVKMDEIIEEAVRILKASKASAEHISEQTARIRNLDF